MPLATHSLVAVSVRFDEKRARELRAGLDTDRCWALMGEISAILDKAQADIAARIGEYEQEARDAGENVVAVDFKAARR